MKLTAILFFIAFLMLVQTAKAGILPTSRGGTGANLSPIAGGVISSTSGTFTIVPAGSQNNLLQSNGNSTPSFVSHITVGAGTTVAGGAPITIPTGSTLATPVSGSLETNGTHIWWTDSLGVRHQLDNDAGNGLH